MKPELVALYLQKYLQERPLFLSLIRSTEASLYHEYLPLKSPVLDVGCGDGFFAKTVFGHVDVGLDVEDSRMKESENLNVYRKLVAYDGRIFPFKNNVFQTVVSNCVFEHIPDISLLVSEIYRVLKPGGRLITTVMAKPWDDYLFGSIFLGNWYKQYMRKKQAHLNLFPLEKWNELFQSKKFSIAKKVGYMDSVASKLMDISHYVSIPGLISYTLTGRWVQFPSLTRIYPINFFSRLLSTKVDPSESAAIFYVLEKRT